MMNTKQQITTVDEFNARYNDIGYNIRVDKGGTGESDIYDLFFDSLLFHSSIRAKDAIAWGINGIALMGESCRCPTKSWEDQQPIHVVQNPFDKEGFEIRKDTITVPEPIAIAWLKHLGVIDYDFWGKTAFYIDSYWDQTDSDAYLYHCELDTYYIFSVPEHNS